MEQHPRDIRDSDSELFDRLERLTSDPAIEAVIDRARNMERMYSQDELEDGTVSDAVVALNETWPLMDAALPVHGYVTTDNPETGEPETHYSDGELFVSGGFCAYLEGADVSSLVGRAQYLLYEVDQSGIVSETKSTAELDKAVLDYSDHSPYLAENRLRDRSPELAAIIDATMASYPNRSDGLLALRERKLVISPEQVAENSDIPRDAGRYMYAQFAPDTELPYFTKISGAIYARQEGGWLKPIEVKDQGRIVTPKDVVYLPIVQVDEQGEEWYVYTPTLHVTLHGKQAKSGAGECLLPLESLTQLVALRGLAD